MLLKEGAKFKLNRCKHELPLAHTHTPLLCRYAICPFASCKHPGIAVKATELMPDTRTDPRNNIYPKQACHEPRIPQSNCYYRLLEPALLKR